MGMKRKGRENGGFWRGEDAEARKFHAVPTRNRARVAFTLLELMVVVGTIALVMCFVLPRMARAKTPSHRIKCVNNLKNVGLAYRIYATDNGDRFPWQHLGTNGVIRVEYLADPAPYILAVTNELSTPKIVVCPQDTRREATNWIEFSRENLSYFVSADGEETLPQSFLAGDRNLTNRSGRLAPGLRQLSLQGKRVGWDHTIHTNQGNACMGDGSVQQLSSARLREQFWNTGLSGSNITISVP